MLSREVMGLFCLGVVWVTALLVAGAAWQELRDLRALARRAKRAIVGTVDGDDLAEWTVEQTGRTLDVAGDEAIAFHDRTFRSRILGGRVRVGDELVEVPAGDGEVWIDARARAEAADCAGAQELDAAYAQARKAKGFHREVRVRVRAGERVWVFGDVVSTIESPRVLPAQVDRLRALHPARARRVRGGDPARPLDPALRSREHRRRRRLSRVFPRRHPARRRAPRRGATAARGVLADSLVLAGIAPGPRLLHGRGGPAKKLKLP